MTRVAILDTGVGNVGSVRRAFERLGAEVVTTSDPSRSKARRTEPTFPTP